MDRSTPGLMRWWNVSGMGALAPLTTIVHEMRFAFWYAKYGRMVNRITTIFGTAILVGALVIYLITEEEESIVEEVVKRFNSLPRLRVGVWRA